MKVTVDVPNLAECMAALRMSNPHLTDTEVSRLAIVQGLIAQGYAGAAGNLSCQFTGDRAGATFSWNPQQAEA